ncbi:MAG: GspE/PulE family protein [Bacillota bacterium]
MPPKKRLGELLVDSGLITQAQLQEALKLQKQTGDRLGRVLISHGFVTEQDIINVLEFQLGISQVELHGITLDPEVVKMVPEHLVRRHKAIPVKRSGNILLVAMVDPLNVLAIDDFRLASGCEIEPAISTEKEIDQAIQKYYGIQGLEEVSAVEEGAAAVEIGEKFNLDADSGLGGAPVVRVVNSMIQQAVQARASDIHVEPLGDRVRVRFRVDGLLRDMMSLPKGSHPSIISRIKIMADMDIAEKRLPQDGRVQIRASNRQVDLRVSSMPTIFGEKIVIRILDKSARLVSLEDLGFSEAVLHRYRNLIKFAYGMILVTGPTGSGKTTTLYATLNEISSIDKNIITIEDPVEYILEGINQTQVHVKSGLTFAVGLRSILRQDPDVIMVGEIRDAETADIAVRAATTGHLVLSTLHTNDAAGAVTRLIDTGVEPFLVASSVIGVVAQRLVRKICPHCKASYQLPPDSPHRVFIGVDANAAISLYKGQGCRQCEYTGYRGRLAIQEVLAVSAQLRSLILEKASSEELKNQAVSEGMKTLKEDGIIKALEGLTTIEEVIRVAYADEVITG